MQTTRIEIDPKIILYAFLSVGSIWLLVQLKEVVLMLFLAFILNAAFRPLVDGLEKRRIPRFISILLIFMGFVLVIGLTSGIIINEFLVQFRSLIDALPRVYAGVVDFVNQNLPFLADYLQLDSLQSGVDELVRRAGESNFVQSLITGSTIPNVVEQASVLLGGVANLLLSFFTVVIVSIYMLQRKDTFYKGLLLMLPEKRMRAATNVLQKVESSLGAWLVGQFLLMAIIGVMTYVVMALPGLFDPEFKLAEYALPIALLAMIFEALPSLGPLITMVVAGVLALGTMGVGGVVYVIISFLIIQNIEAILVIPQVMKRAVGIDPILTILGVLGGFHLGGVIGALMAVPVIAVVQITLMEIVYSQKVKEHRQIAEANNIHEKQMVFNFVGFVRERILGIDDGK